MPLIRTSVLIYIYIQYCHQYLSVVKIFSFLLFNITAVIVTH